MDLRNRHQAPKRVRVTRRILSDRDHRGRRVLIARKGEEISRGEALRRGIDETDIEAIDKRRKVKLPKASDADRETTAGQLDDEDTKAAREEQRKADAERAAAHRAAQGGGPSGAAATPNAGENGDGDGGVEFPVHNGGGNWTLSDGSKFRGKKDAALAAEAALQAGGGSGGSE